MTLARNPLTVRLLGVVSLWGLMMVILSVAA